MGEYYFVPLESSWDGCRIMPSCKVHVYAKLKSHPLLVWIPIFFFLSLRCWHIELICFPNAMCNTCLQYAMLHRNYFHCTADKQEYLLTSNNQRLRSVGDNNRMSKRFHSQCCALCKVHVIDCQSMCDQISSDKGANASNQIAFCAFHSFLVEVQMNPGYIHATHA